MLQLIDGTTSNKNSELYRCKILQTQLQNRFKRLSRCITTLELVF